MSQVLAPRLWGRGRLHLRCTGSHSLVSQFWAIQGSCFPVRAWVPYSRFRTGARGLLNLSSLGVQRGWRKLTGLKDGAEGVADWHTGQGFSRWVTNRVRDFPEEGKGVWIPKTRIMSGFRWRTRRWCAAVSVAGRPGTTVRGGCGYGTTFSSSTLRLRGRVGLRIPLPDDGDGARESAGVGRPGANPGALRA